MHHFTQRKILNIPLPLCVSCSQSVSLLSSLSYNTLFSSFHLPPPHSILPFNRSTNQPTSNTNLLFTLFYASFYFIFFLFFYLEVNCLSSFPRSSLHFLASTSKLQIECRVERCVQTYSQLGEFCGSTRSENRFQGRKTVDRM